MLMHDSPVASATNLSSYLMANYAALPAHLQDAAIKAVQPASPVERVALGMEVLISAAQPGPLPNAETGLNALGSAAMQVAEGGFWNKADRALQAIKRVRFELGEWSEELPEPSWPVAEHAIPPADD